LKVFEELVFRNRPFYALKQNAVLYLPLSLHISLKRAEASELVRNDRGQDTK